LFPAVNCGHPMKLSHHTDYALRLLIYLAAHHDRFATIHQVAGAYGISSHHLAKIVQELSHHGWVRSTRGRGGGLRLACKAADVPLGAVVRAMESSLALVECMGEASTCPIEPACGLKHVLIEARDAFLGVLDRYTLQDLVSDPQRLVPLLVQGGERDTA